MRKRTSFDENWRFCLGDAPQAEQTNFEDADWPIVNLPHDWSISGPFRQDHRSGGGGAYLPGGIGWYRKTFEMAAQDIASIARVEFDGVYKNCTVWINGNPLGFHPYGYTSFAYELTSYLVPGKNILAVRVDNSQQPDARWYTGSGIYRHTWLVLTDALHVDHWGTCVTTPVVSEASARVAVRVRVRNAGPLERACKLLTEILDAEGKVVASGETHHPLAPGQVHEALQLLRVSQPRLWRLEDPYLYRLRNTLYAGGEAVDEYYTPFGIRAIGFDAERGFLLNGQPVKINGVCLHHDGGCVGAAVPERVWQRRLEILKEMGCNGIRTSHYPPAPEFLDLCDRMGFLVMDEAFDEWKRGKFPYGYHDVFEEWAADDLKSMIQRDRNHPSIVIWSVGNEIPEQMDPDGVSILQKLVDIVHQEDPTRPATSGCDNIASHTPATQAFLELLDVVGYNYAGRWEDRREKYYSIDHHQFPQWKMIGTENISIPGIRGEYSLEKSSGWRGNYASSSIEAEQLWRFTRTYDYVAGDFMWTGIDYLGETSWPHKNSSYGVLDLCGFPKDGYYFYQSQWIVRPMVYLFPHWNWEGQQGRVIPVLCFTNCDEVELFLNGKSFGAKSYIFPARGLDVTKSWGEQDFQAMRHATTGDLHLAWDVPYEPGILKAVGKKNGEVACVQEVKTAGAPAKLAVTPDREAITADGMDVVHLTVQVLDAAGVRVPSADNPITFEITGEGSLIGVDNGNPASHESFQARERKAFNGLCLGIVKSTGTSGKIQVKVSSPGLKGSQVVVKTRLR